MNNTNNSINCCIGLKTLGKATYVLLTPYVTPQLPREITHPITASILAYLALLISWA